MGQRGLATTPEGCGRNIFLAGPRAGVLIGRRHQRCDHAPLGLHLAGSEADAIIVVHSQ